MRLLLLLLFVIAPNLWAARFSIAQHGDLHIGTAGAVKADLDGAISFILANTNDGDYNFVGYISTGDCYEQSTNSMYNSYGPPSYWNIEEMTNAMQSMVDAGLFVWLCDGNHDADVPVSDGVGISVPEIFAGCWTMTPGYEWTNIFPHGFFSQQVGWQSSNVFGYNGSGVQYAMTYTNPASGIKLLWCNYDSSVTGGVSVAETALEIQHQTEWIKARSEEFSDHFLIVGAHFFVAFKGSSKTYFNKPVSWSPKLSAHDYSGVADYPNHGINRACWEPNNALQDVDQLALCVAGHVRSMLTGHVGVIATNGHVIDVSCMNMQSPMSLTGKNIIKVITFDSVQRVIYFRTVDTELGTVVEDGDLNYTTALTTSIGFIHNWTVEFPFNKPAARRWKLTR
jgi:hypothetical protein